MKTYRFADKPPLFGIPRYLVILLALAYLVMAAVFIESVQ